MRFKSWRWANRSPPMIQRLLTLRRAIVLAVVVALLVPVLLIMGYSWFTKYDKDIHKRTQEPLWNISKESATSLLEAMMANEDLVQIEVRDSNGEIFVKRDRPERHKGYTESTNRNISYRGSTIGSVRLAVNSTRQQKIISENLTGYMLALAAQVALSIVLVLLLLERRLVGPLKRIGSGAERLASGQLDQPFSWQRLDEIGMLSQRLEQTRISLRRLFDELGKKNIELEQDIARRHSVEQELSEREARFRTLVGQSPIAIIEWEVKSNAAASSRPCPNYGQKNESEDNSGRNDCLGNINTGDSASFSP